MKKFLTCLSLCSALILTNLAWATKTIDMTVYLNQGKGQFSVACDSTKTGECEKSFTLNSDEAKGTVRWEGTIKVHPVWQVASGSIGDWLAEGYITIKDITNQTTKPDEKNYCKVHYYLETKGGGWDTTTMEVKANDQAGTLTNKCKPEFDASENKGKIYIN